MSELHSDILSHAKQEETGVSPQPIQGITVHDSDVLQPEPPRPGGLVRKDIVRYFLLPVIPFHSRLVSNILFDNLRSRSLRPHPVHHYLV